MKRAFFILLGIVAAWLLWRWWTVRNQNPVEALNERARQADAFGQRAENAGLANRPRLASDEALGRLQGILAILSPQTAQPAAPSTVPKDPFLFGFN
jgi:ABC-type nickel/cobalt efflux system permease component RcnA